MGCQGRRGTSCVLGALALCALALASPAAASTIAVGDAQVGEGATATFTVTRSAGLLAGATSVAYRTLDGSAGAADYTGRSGSLDFGSAVLGATQVQQVAITIVDDPIDEPAETFELAISGQEVTDGRGSATIDDNDPTPSLSVGDAAAVREGPGAKATFAVRLTGPSSRKVTLAYSTANASATAGQDYAPGTGTVAVPAGSQQAEIVVEVLDDAVDEPVETFQLQLSAPDGATLDNDTAGAMIVDDDEPPAPQPADPKPVTTTPAGGQSSGTGPAPTTGSSSPATGTTAPPQALGLSSPRLKRPATVLLTISCPQTAGSCTGRVTLFSIANRRSRVKALRKERKLGRIAFSVPGGRARTLSLELGRTDRALLGRTGRMRVRAYAITQDAAGRAGVRTVSGTLVARTAHSSPSGA